MSFTRLMGLAAGLLLAVVCAGCVAGKEIPAADGKAPEAPVTVTPDQAAAKALAEAYRKAFWHAFQSGDTTPLLPFLPAASRQRAGELLHQRQMLEKRFGKAESIRFGCEVAKPLVRDYYWIIRCVKKSPPPAAAQVTELFLLVRIGCVNGKCVVAGSGIRP